MSRLPARCVRCVSALSLAAFVLAALPVAVRAEEAATTIDQAVSTKLREMGAAPSDVCSDAVFVRRVYLDVTGRLPTVAKSKAFLASEDPARREKLIDELLASDAFADYWALKWGDLLRIKSEFPSNLWPNAVQAYHGWVRRSIRDNTPYDQFVRELLTATGSNFREPPVNYYRAFLKRDAEDIADVTALLFMGARIQCARCHEHPSEPWTQEDHKKFSAFFYQLQYKKSKEWKEEIVYVNTRRRMRDAETKELVPPTPPGGEPLDVKYDDDLRVAFADWLTAKDNPWFARAAVNRIWFWLMGTGIVSPADDIRPSNPPSNPELLALLEREFIDHGYDTRRLFRLILNSKTYQRSAATSDTNAMAAGHFSHYRVRRLPAETLLDAIGDVTRQWDTYRSNIPEPFIVMPEATRATCLADGSVSLPFLELFGRPPRDTAFEQDRDNELSARQTLYLLNSGDVYNKINRSPRIARWLSEKTATAVVIDELYHAALSRPPTEEEQRALTEHIDREGANRRNVLADAMWAVLNTKEFVFNH